MQNRHCIVKSVASEVHALPPRSSFLPADVAINKREINIRDVRLHRTVHQMSKPAVHAHILNLQAGWVSPQPDLLGSSEQSTSERHSQRLFPSHRHHRHLSVRSRTILPVSECVVELLCGRASRRSSGNRVVLSQDVPNTLAPAPTGQRCSIVQDALQQTSPEFATLVDQIVPLVRIPLCAMACEPTSLPILDASHRVSQFTRRLPVPRIYSSILSPHELCDGTCGPL